MPFTEEELLAIANVKKVQALKHDLSLAIKKEKDAYTNAKKNMDTGSALKVLHDFQMAESQGKTTKWMGFLASAALAHLEKHFDAPPITDNDRYAWAAKKATDIVTKLQEMWEEDSHEKAIEEVMAILLADGAYGYG